MEGDGPTYGDKVDLGLIISGKDTVATDKVCSQIIGLSWEEVKYLRLANRMSDKIKVAGECITNVQRFFNIPKKSYFFHLCFRLIYIFDILFQKIFNQHLNQFLYSTGYVGTNPKIIKEKCDECGDCIEVCPIEGVMNIENHKVDYKSCIRCLDCYFACNQQAIIVKGASRPKEH
jgi:NAD-dependent dihydropyrimidine dehydrogenase PreA subunit